MSELRVYEKIVRTDIPDIIRANGSTPTVTDIPMSARTAKEKFKEKLQEEINELISAKSRDDIAEEAIDVIQCVYDYVSLFNLSEEDLELVRKAKVAKRGTYISKQNTLTYLKHVEDK